MRLYVLADRGPSRSIREVIAETPVDVIVTLGDLELSQIRELELIDLPKLGVYGNHCSGSYMESVGLVNMHLKTLRVGDVLFGGFEGSVRYKDSPSAKMYTQEEASSMLAAFPRVDVMITHCPPYGINDDRSELAHTGYQGLLDYIEREQPAYLFHGHTYPNESELVKKYLNTKIEYVFGEKIVTIELPTR